MIRLFTKGWDEGAIVFFGAIVCGHPGEKDFCRLRGARRGEVFGSNARAAFRRWGNWLACLRFSEPFRWGWRGVAAYRGGRMRNFGLRGRRRLDGLAAGK